MVISYNRVERDLVFISIQNTILAKSKIKKCIETPPNKTKSRKEEQQQQKIRKSQGKINKKLQKSSQTENSIYSPKKKFYHRIVRNGVLL